MGGGPEWIGGPEGEGGVRGSAVRKRDDAGDVIGDATDRRPTDGPTALDWASLEAVVADSIEIN